MDKDNCLAWHIVEKAINEEIKWLEKVIDIDPRSKSDKSLESQEVGNYFNYYIFYRAIAILIIRGVIRAKEINSKNLWGPTKMLSGDYKHRHGKDWHIKMMNIIDNYFREQQYEVTAEPNLYHGRADLGIFKDDQKDLYVEIGTTSIDKLCTNLHFMKSCIFLLVPTENMAIEFEIL